MSEGTEKYTHVRCLHIKVGCKEQIHKAKPYLPKNVRVDGVWAA